MQNNNTELFVFIDGTWKALELSDSIPMPISYSIADIRDITKRNTTYSKTLSIPGTKNNNDLLSYLFDIANVSTYNVNRKVRCSIVVDTIPIMSDAYIQITDIKTDNNLSFIYECSIIGDTDSIVKDFGNKLMTDLTISELGHTYSESSIVSSWTKEYNSGYFYGLVDYGYNWDSTRIGPSASGTTYSNGTKVNQMKPSLYIKYLWKKMFSEAGWSYESNFIDGVSLDYMLMLSGVELKQSFTFSNHNSFRASLSTNKVYTLGHTYSRPSGGVYFNSPLQWGYTGSNINVIQNPANNTLINQTDNTVSVVGNTNGILRDYDNYNSFTSSRIPFSDDINSPNGDPSNSWSTTVWEYVVPNITGIQSIGGSIDITIPATASLFAAGSLVDNYLNTTAAAAPQFIYFDVLLFRSSIYNLVGTTKQYLPINDESQVGWNPFLSQNGWKLGYVYGSTVSVPTSNLNYNKLSPGSRTVKQFSSILFNWPGAPSNTNPYTPLLPGEKLWMKLVTRASVAGNVAGATIGKDFSVTLNTSNTYAYNYIDPILIEGQPIDPQGMLPKQFKQIDFFTGLVKMFNLYIEPHKTISKRLIIEPRDDYYSGGTERNWTNKVDISQEVHQQVVAETQAKQLYLTYKQDKDDYNENYFNSTKEIYGQHKYVVDNDFIKGDSKVEVPFASTPITYLSGPNGLSNDSIILPVIAKNNSGSLQNTDFIPRILYRTTTGTVPILDSSNYWMFNSTLRSSYPYLGHFNDPRSGTEDLNFGQTQFLYYGLNKIGVDNLFTNYYERQLNELTDRDSRIVSVNMVLNPQDMNDFSFRDRIILDGISSGGVNYFRVNKIEYDPTLKGTFKVELLKAKDIPRRPRLSKWINNTVTHMDIGLGVGVSLGSGNVTDGGSNVFLGSDNVAVGGPAKTLIVGDNNIIGGGVKNTMILGDGVSTLPFSKNVLLVGDNITMKSGQTGIISNTPLTLNINYIDACNNEVLNPFNNITIINYIDSGHNNILPIGNMVVTNKIDSGSDTV